MSELLKNKFFSKLVELLQVPLKTKDPLVKVVEKKKIIKSKKMKALTVDAY